MAKIQCFFQGVPSRPYVASWINIPHYPPKLTSFLIDTGSALSFLSPTDAESIGVIVDELPNPPSDLQINTIGGTIQNSKLGVIEQYSAKFINIDGRFFEIPGENLIVLKQGYGYKLPSVWGVDFLTKLGFRLNLDHGKSVAELCNQ